MANTLTDAQQANLGLGDNPFLGQDNPYLQSVIDKAGSDMVRNYNLTTQPAFNTAMAKSGSFGNAGLAQMNSEAQNQLQNNLGNMANAMRSQDYTNQQNMYQWQQGFTNQQNQWNKQFDESQRQYDQNFGRNVFNDAYTQNMQNLQMGMGMLGTLNGYNQQDLQNANAMQNTPMNYYNNFAQQANSMGQGYGTTTQTQGTSSNPWLSAMGAAQLGMGAWNSYNSGGSGYNANNPFPSYSTVSPNYMGGGGGSPSYFGGYDLGSGYYGSGPSTVSY